MIYFVFGYPVVYAVLRSFNIFGPTNVFFNTIRNIIVVFLVVAFAETGWGLW